MNKIVSEYNLKNSQLILSDKNLIIKVETEIECLPNELITSIELLDFDINSIENNLSRRTQEIGRKESLFNIPIGFILMIISSILLYIYGFEGNGKIVGLSYFLFLIGGNMFLRGCLEYSPKNKLLVDKKIRIKFKDNSYQDFSLFIEKKHIKNIEQFIMKYTEFKEQKF